MGGRAFGKLCPASGAQPMNMCRCDGVKDGSRLEAGGCSVKPVVAK